MAKVVWPVWLFPALFVAGFAFGQQPPQDLIFVLDNSGSMKANDPGFLTRAVVSEFAASPYLSKTARVGLVVFDDNARLVMPLSPLADTAAQGRLKASLNSLNYAGRYTDCAAGIERAVYELKQQGRPDSDKSIVFMTDGIVDTGDRARNLERRRWLKEELAAECAASGIRIFGVAFTEAADYELIQDYFQSHLPPDVALSFGVSGPTLQATGVPEDSRVTEPYLKYGEIEFFKGAGCGYCDNTGYKGRIGVFEVMPVGEEMRRLILKKPSGTEVKELAIKAGMVTMRQSAIEKLLAGVTTSSEVRKKVFVGEDIE